MLPVGLLPAISRTFGESESTTGLLVSLYAAFVAVLAVPLTLATRAVRAQAAAADRHGRLCRQQTLLAALAPSFWALAGARALGGTVHALFFSVCIGYAARLVPPGLTGRALALASTGASAGFVLGVPLATALGNAVGWRGAFLALAVLMAVVFVAVAVKLPPVEHATGRDLLDPRRRRRLLAATASDVLVYLGHYTLYTYVSVLLLHAHAGSGAVGPILLGFGALGLIAISVSGPRLDHHFRRSTIAVLAVLLIGIAGTGAGFPSLGLVLLAGAIWNAAFGPVASIFQTAAVRTNATSPDLAGAFVNAASNVGIGGGAALGSIVLHQAGIRSVAWAATACIALALAVVIRDRQTFPKQP